MEKTSTLFLDVFLSIILISPSTQKSETKMALKYIPSPQKADYMS